MPPSERRKRQSEFTAIFNQLTRLPLTKHGEFPVVYGHVLSLFPSLRSDGQMVRHGKFIVTISEIFSTADRLLPAFQRASKRHC
jgi:hypothetical protein